MEHSGKLSYNLENSIQYKYDWEQRLSIIKNTMNNNTTKRTDLKPSVIGIDLGSLNTKIAAVEKGVVDIITNEANLRQTPSVVGYGQNERLIGETGFGKMKSNLANTIVAPQRYLGLQECDFVKDESKFASCRPNVEENDLVFKVKCQGQEEKFIPEQITAALLNKIESIVKLNQLKNNFQVIAIPNYLSHQQRKAFLNSMKIARESIKEDYGYKLITESTAIGLDFGFYKKNQFPEKEEDAPVVLFVDFGHSKLSLYAMKFTTNYQKVIYESHMSQLGCKDIDQLMLSFYADQFEQANPNMDISVMESKKAVLKLLEGIEKQRKVLSGNLEYDYNIDCLLEDNDFSYSMKREQFEEISKPALEKITLFFNEFKTKLTELGVDISHIELIGGGSRIPCFIKRVTDSFEIEPSRTLNSSECIARGAALCSAMQSHIFRVKEYFTFDVNFNGLSCSWKGQGDQIEDENCEAIIMNSNETMFTEKKIELSVKSTKQKMQFSIKPLLDTSGLYHQICSLVLSFPEIIEEESNERKVSLIVKFDSNKLIQSVSAYLIGQKDEQIQLENMVFNEKLSKETLDVLIAKERQLVTKDSSIMEEYQNRNKFESNLYSFKDKLNSINRNQKTRDFVNPILFNECLDYASAIENDLEQIKDYKAKTAQVQEKLKEFVSIVESVQKRFIMVDQSLSNLSEFIDAVVSGRVKSVKYYPGEEIEKIKEWVKISREKLHINPKFNEPELTVQDVQNMDKVLKEKIQECQAEQMRKQEEEERQKYQRQRQQPAFGFNSYERPSFNSFGPRRGRNSGFNSPKQGFFGGFF